MSDCDYLSKLIIFGADGVGKTTLETHLDPVFDPQFSSEFTIGVSFQHLNVDIKGYRVRLQIWLMSNKDRFIKITEFPKQLSGASGAILLYDITNASSLEKIPVWCEIVKESCGNIPILLVGNKVDEEERRAVSKKSAEELRERYNLASYMEISAKTGASVKRMFELVGELMLKRFG